MSTKGELFKYIEDNFGVLPEYPFSKFPQTAIFRHEGNRKWFAAVLRVERYKLGIEAGEVCGDECEIVNLKCDPAIAGSFREREGILPGYHMNKEHWISVLLDGTVENELLFELINLSYRITEPKIRIIKK